MALIILIYLYLSQNDCGKDIPPGGIGSWYRRKTMSVNDRRLGNGRNACQFCALRRIASEGNGRDRGVQRDRFIKIKKILFSILFSLWADTDAAIAIG